MAIVDLDLADDLVDLGAALGILTAGNGAGSAALNEAWFNDPGRYMGAVFADPAQREAVLRLARRRLDDPLGDLDLTDVPEAQQWVPLASTAAGGLFLVVEDEGPSAVLGLGVRVASTADPHLSVTAHVPVIRAGTDAAGFVLGTAAGTISVAVSVAPGPEAGRALQSGALALSVPTDGAAPSFAIDLVGLRVDASSAPRDLHVDSSEPAGELLDVAVSVLQGLVLDSAADSSLAHLLGLVGLGGDSQLPTLPLADVFSEGTTAMVGWLRQVTADTTVVRAWLGHLAGLLELDPVTAVTGEGTAEAPYAVTLGVGAAAVAFTLTVTTAADSGDPVLRPGLRATMPAPSGVPGKAEAAVELAEITVGASISGRPLPSARLIAHLGPELPLAPGTDPLVETTAPDGSPVRIEALEAGIALDAGGRPVLVLAARGVTVGTHPTYPVVDLTMPDAVLEVAQGALDEVVNRLLATLGNSTEATALLALLGLRRPAGLVGGAPWPHEVGLTAFFSDPLAALRTFHHEVLSAGDWGTLLGELALLLRGGVSTPVTGTGADADPWTAEVATDTIGTAALTASGAGTDRLALGLHLAGAPRPLTDSTAMRLVITAGLLSLEFGEQRGVEVLPAVDAGLEVGDDFPIDLGIVALELGTVVVSLGWTRANGLALRVAVADAVAVIGDERVSLPVPPYDSGEDLPAFPADFPWPVITRLLGDALLTRGLDWLEGLAALARWDEGLPPGVTFPTGTPVGDLAGLPIERLPGDPAGVLRDWVAELLRDIAGAAAPQIAAWIGAITAGTVPGAGPFGVPVGGGGTAADPYSVGIGTAADAAELLVWFEPDGTTLFGVSELLIPAELSYPLDLLEGDPPDPETLAGLLRQAARSIPELKPVVDGRPGLGEGLARLIARLADSDVLVPAAAQQLAGAVAAHTVEGLTHLEAPLGFDPATHLPAGTDPAHVLYVTEPLRGLAEWPNRGGAALVDLTEAGLAPDALDVTGLAAPGPWFVRLATRVAAGDAERQAARLQRAVAAAVATLPAGATLTVVAHGPAALAARRVAAAPGSGIAHLVTVAAPLDGATFEFLDEPATGDAVRALQALGPLLSDEARANPFAAEGLAIVETLTTLLDSGSTDELPLADYRLAAPAESLAVGVAGTSVTMSLPQPDVTRAIASLVRHAIESGLGRLRPDRPADAVGLGARVRLGTDEPATGRVAVRAELRADLHRFRLRDTAAQQPLPRVLGTIEVRRVDGWLAGGPRSDHDPTLPREPRLRWAELTLVSDSGPSGMGLRSSITLHEAAALGISRPAWTIELSSADGLPEEARILLGRLAAALAETDAGPTAVAVVALFRALGLVEGQGESLGLVVDAAEQLLVDPATAIRARLDAADAALLAALHTLIGPAMRPDEDAAISTGGVEIGLRLSGTRAITLRTATGGLSLPAGLTLEGGITVTADGRSHADLRVEPSAPGPRAGPSALVLHVDPAEARPVTLSLEQSAERGAVSAELFPQPDTAELTRLLVSLVPAELTRLGLEFAAETAPEVVEPLLEALGLRLPGDPAGFVRHPAGLLLDPIAWLRHRGLLAGAGPRDATAVQGLIDGLRGALGGTGPSGTLPLPWGLVGTAVPAASGGGVTLSLGWPAPQVAGAVDLSATFSVTLPDAGAPTASVAAAIGVTATPGAARVDLAVGGATALSLSITPTSGGAVVLHIIPAGGGLAGAAAGVAALLPLALDALTEAGANGPLALQAVGDAVETLGDALALRRATGFDAAALRALAEDPAGQLVSRIRASVAGANDALPALAAIVAPSLPAGAITVDAATRTVRLAIPSAPLVVSLAVPATGTPQLCGVLTDFQPVTGLSIAGTLCVSPDGLRRLELSAEVIDESLLAVNQFAFFPFAAAIVGPDASPGGDRFELGLWLAPPATADRNALLLTLPVGGAAGVVCRPQTGADHSDIAACVTAATRGYLVPLLVDLVASFAAVEAALERPIAIIGGSLGDLLDGVLLDRPVATGPFHLDPSALDPAGLLARLVETGLRLAQAITSELAPPALQPFAVSLFVDSANGVDRGGVRISAPPGPGLTLVDTGEVAIAVEADARWFKTPPRPAEGGLTLLLVAHDTAGFRLDPELRIEGLGLRVSAPATDKLVDLGMTIRSIAVHAALDRRGAGAGEVQRLGGHLQIDGLGVPLGEATGDNPVAAKILSSGADSSQAGDSTELVPTFSPAVVLWREAGETTVLMRAGDPPGPWWLPIQRSFGPIYVEQVGVGSEEAGGRTTAVQLLLDGGLSMLGLTVQVDDLSVTLPTATPLQPGTWKLGLAGLGLGLDAGGLSIAGGLRERRRPTPPGNAPLPPDYVGMVRVEFSQFGITAIGGYGEFPDGAGSTYTSFFLFGALSAPLGGPPAFFVTGIGAGAGINRRLIVPGDMAALPSFPLIAAMDPSSDLAADPMGSLDRLGETFPAERGALWFAAGIRFTSFVVVESIAVVSAEIGDGLEINLLGLSRMDLPTPLTPMARIELALRARFCTVEGVLSIQAQLTDNSWIINDSCRLTGGFAYVTWFRTGQFVLTLGGYHPRFAKPPEFPAVPRLGFAWQVSDIVAIKGTSYFALTASCVMAGAELDVTLDAGWLWGRLVAGFDALVSWDPFHYLVHAYATVTVGFKIEICVPFLGCARVSFSMSIGADLEIEGPELRGTAKLDLDVTSFTVRFGATGTPTSNAALAWHEFYDKYLVTGDEQRRVVDATVTTGGLALPAGGTPDDGSAQHPWKLVAEFVLTTTTKAATTTVNGVAIAGAAGLPLGAGPMKIARITSDLRVSVRAEDGSDHTAKLRLVPVLGGVPAAVWETHDGPEPPAEAKVRPAGVGATVIAEAVPDGSAVPLPVDDVDPPGPRHPLPFHAERDQRPELEVVVDEASAFVAAQPTGTVAILSRAERYLDAGVFRSTGLSAVEQRVFGADRAGPPRLAPLTEGIVDPVKAPAAVADRPAQPPEPPPDTRVVPPILDSQLRLVPPGTTATRAATSVGADRLVGRRVRRKVPPTLAGIRSSMARTPVPAQLIINPAPSAAEQGTVLAVGATPRTRVAGGQAERRGGLLASQPDSDALEALTKRLADGVPLRPGDVQVWRLPNSAADVPGQPRPTLAVKGDQRSRLVFFDRGGQVLHDVTDLELSVAVPVGAHRVVLAGLGGGDVGASRLLGWHAATMVAQVSADAYLAPGAVIRAEAVRTVRRRQTVGTALLRAGEAAAGSGPVTTRFTGGLSVVLLALDVEGAVDGALDGLVLGVDGARRAGEPLVVVAGDRTYALFSIDSTASRGPITVAVGSDDRWLLSAVVGSTGSTADLAERVTAAGVGDLVAELVVGSTGSSVVSWSG
jgi:large repetitive protein